MIGHAFTPRSLITSLLFIATLATPLLAQNAAPRVTLYSLKQVPPEKSPWVLFIAGKKTSDWKSSPADTVRVMREHHRIPAYLHVRDGITSIYVAESYGSLRDERLQLMRKKVQKVLNQLVAQKADEISKDPNALKGARVIASRVLAVPHPDTPDTGFAQNKMPALPGDYNVDKYNIFKCKGPWTLRVASFKGFSGRAGVRGTFRQRREIPAGVQLEVKTDLWKAFDDANDLVEKLRQRKYEAYVAHGFYDSYVTLGSFKTTTDPRVKELSRKWLEDPISRSVGILRLQPMLIRIPAKAKGTFKKKR